MKNGVGIGLWVKLAGISPDMLCTFNAKGVFTHVSQASFEILGYTPEELVGRDYTQVTHPDCLVATREAIHDILSGRKTRSFENCYVHKHGHRVHLHWSAAWSEEDALVLCVARDITELHNSRVELEESEQRYRSLFDNSPDLVLVEDRHGRVQDANQAFLDLVGMAKEALTGKLLASLLPQGVAAASERYREQALAGHLVRFDLELEKDGQPLILDTQKVPIVTGGQVTGVQTIARNITPFVRSLETIRTQSEKLGSVFESITDAFVLLDREWRLTYINREAERMVGIHREKHLGKSVWEVFPGQVGGDFYVHYTQALETGKAVHFTSFLEECQAWLQVKAFPSSEGLSVYFEDITGQVRNRQELEKLSIVASKTNNGVIIADRNYRIDWVNEGFTRLSGYTLDEALGKVPSELLQSKSADATVFTSIKDKLKAGEQVSMKTLDKKKSGEAVWMAVEATGLFEQGELIGFLEVLTDITDLENSKLELSKLTQDLYRQNSDLQQFTYIVSHNLRAHVANAMGLAGLLAAADRGSANFDKTLSFLNQSMLHLDSILRDMNTILSIRERGADTELEQVGLYPVVEQALHSYEDLFQCAGARVNVELGEGPSAKANKAYLYSIFHNLLSNALKYRSLERELTINIRLIGSSRKGHLLSFSDNGVGFEMGTARENIFKLYKRFHTDRKGRGIGLYLVKAHLEAMGGHVEVSSQVGVGTRFLLYLPR